ncbi:septum formation initiator family protein [Gramella sp. AN32]|uniref:Septum formation initiator family protein n=1 Tax=Christiangramia antarctica TaxID=2058158 RepID=A0ABW5X6E3_9FLAO|nr:septum formation initiator family protein [Gramella sp. AN32]MCM4154427.1 septum formation initiator [Gramella sp. AN32]
MKYKDLKEKGWFKVISNKYVLISLVFAGWMFFLDTNSWFIHHELNQEIDELQDNKNYYQGEINKDKATIENLHDSVELEKFARQKYYMKRDNEDIYIIEYDSVN